MKNKKIIGKLCLLLLLACLTFVIYTPSVFAVQYDGSTEIIAHIETSSAETAQNSSDSAPYDDNDISTGDIATACVVISFILFVISALVIFLCNKNYSLKNKNT